MVRINLTYEGDLHCRAVHGPSEAVLATDAPVDNQGRGESFSPTDLVATALGTCALTIMGIEARSHNVSLEGASATVIKEMTDNLPRRIARLTLDFHLPAQVAPEHRELLEKAARSCPVCLSLHPDVEKEIVFHWG